MNPPMETRPASGGIGRETATVLMSAVFVKSKGLSKPCESEPRSLAWQSILESEL